MLSHLSIRNAALIESAEIEFGPGLNILSGETGSGKSMVIDSLGFLLGQKADRDFIRTGCEEAFVSAIFTLSESLAAAVGNLGVDVDEDNSLMISRSISVSGRSNAKINAKAVNLAVLKEVSSLLADIHSQHEHQSLLNSAKHIEMLDRFLEMDDVKRKLSEYLWEYRDLSKQAKEISGKTGGGKERLEYISFSLKEIDGAKLGLDEEDVLKARLDTLRRTEDLRQYAASAEEILFAGSQNGLSAHSAVNNALKSIGEALNIDGELKDVYNALESVYIELEDMKADLSRYIDSMDNNSEELKEIEERLEIIYGLKRKYGGTIKDILKFREALKKEYDFITNGAEKLNKLNARRKYLNGLILDVCKQIYNMRLSKAKDLGCEVEAVLRELGMKDAAFEISVAKKQEIGPGGNDKVEFMISPNPGEPLKELAKIASGGEMSRVMLALKTVMADADGIETYVFDEIDTGVSGRTAQKVAEKLNLASKKQQILCITHLPQIAAMADYHLLIEKSVNMSKTLTTIQLLDFDGSVNEISRLLGGIAITETVKANAKELKLMAGQFKKTPG